MSLPTLGSIEKGIMCAMGKQTAVFDTCHPHISSHIPGAEDASQHPAHGEVGAQSRNKTKSSPASLSPGLVHFTHCPRLINSHDPLGICQCGESGTNLASSISLSQKTMLPKPKRSQKQENQQQTKQTQHKTTTKTSFFRKLLLVVGLFVCSTSTERCS